MSTLLTATFHDAARADAAALGLQQAGVPPGDIRIYRHEAPPRLGDPEHTAAVEQEGLQSGTLQGAMRGAAIGLAAGAAAAALAGPVVLVAAGAAIGGYGGSLLGTMHGMEAAEARPDQPVGEELDAAHPHTEAILAIRLDSEPATALTENWLRQHDAITVERRDGPWPDGEPLR